jgi:hypothetical protein
VLLLCDCQAGSRRDDLRLPAAELGELDTRPLALETKTAALAGDRCYVKRVHAAEVVVVRITCRGFSKPRRTEPRRPTSPACGQVDQEM